MRKELTAIFNRHLTVAEAEVAIRAWIRKVEASALTYYNAFIKMLPRYWTFILNYFKQRLSSGFVEGLNNKIKTMKRRCYGIHKPATLFQRIWLDLQGRRRFFLSTPCDPREPILVQTWYNTDRVGSPVRLQTAFLPPKSKKVEFPERRSP